MLIPPRLAAFASRIGLTGLAIAILIALLAVQTIRLEGFKIWPIKVTGALERAEDAKAAAAACEVRHAVTRASVDKLEKSLAAIITEGRNREERQKHAVEAERKRSEALDAQMDRIRSERSQRAPVGQECKSPESVLEAEGL
jgi:hypothetical protein